MNATDRKVLLTDMEIAYKQADNTPTDRRAKMYAVLKVIQKRYKLYSKEVPF